MNLQQADLQNFTKTYLVQGTRPDGRNFTTHREAAINIKSLSNADGSAIVKLGHTTAVCGVKAELAKPTTEQPNQGFLIVNMELPPFCSPSISSGPPGDLAQAAATFVTNSLVNAKVIDLQQLCIEPSFLVWVLYVDLVCLSHDGGLMETALAAASSALKCTTLPKVLFNKDTGEKKIDLTERKPIELKNFAFATTLALFEEGIMLTDPTSKEEQLASGLLTIVHSGIDEAPIRIHMPGSLPISSEVLIECVDISRKRAQQMTRLVNAAVNTPER